MCVACALIVAAASGQDALAQLHVESAHYRMSDGVVEVHLDGSLSWVNPQGIRLVGADGEFVTGTVSHSGDTISITLGEARGDFEGLEHPRYVVVRAGGTNSTIGVYNAEELRAAISYEDTAPPWVSSAGYDAGTGILDVLFSEAVWRINMGSVRVYGADGADVVVGAGRHGPGDDTAYVDLEPGATHAMLFISSGGVADIWGNANSAELSSAVSAIFPDSTQLNSTTLPPLNSTTLPPLNSTTLPPLNSTTLPPLNSTTLPPLNSTTLPPLNSTTLPPLNSTTLPPLNSTTLPPLNSTTLPPLNSTTLPPLNSTTLPPLNSTTLPPLNSTTLPPLNSTTLPPLNSTTLPPLNSTTLPPLNSTTLPPLNSTTLPPLNSTTLPPLNSTTLPPLNSTTLPPLNSTTLPPLNSTTLPPLNSTTLPPLNSTTLPPLNSTTLPPLNSTTLPPLNSTTLPPLNSTTLPPLNSTTLPPLNSTTLPPLNSTTLPPLNSTTLPPLNSTTLPPLNSTTLPPLNSTTLPPLNSTTLPPLNSTTLPPLNSTTLPPLNSTTLPDIPFSNVTYNTVSGELWLYTDYGGILSMPADRKHVTLANNEHSVTVPASNPDCPDPPDTCAGNDAMAAVGEPARGWFAHPSGLRVDASAGILEAAGNATGMTAALNSSAVTVLNPVFQGAAYHTNNGTMSVQFSETVKTVNGSRMSLTDGTHTAHLAGNATIYGGTASFVLSDTGRDRLAGAASLMLYMGEGAVMGVGGYPSAAAGRDVAIYDDTRPAFRGATYHIDNGTMSVQFSETVKTVNGSRMELTGGDRAVRLDGASAYGSAAVATLGLADRTALFRAASLNLNIEAGAVHDMHGNPTDAVRDMPVDMAWGAAELGSAAAASGGGAASFGADDFVTTWNVTTNESITIDVGGHTGTYRVDWGDGTSPTTQSGNAVHTYASAGSYNVSISGDFERFQAGNTINAQKLSALVQWGNKTWNSMYGTFRDASSMVYNATDIPNLAGVTDMSYMFDGATSFNGDLSKWDVSKVTDMSAMFDGATSFNGDLSKWDVSKVTDMSAMFDGATSFNGNISSWDVSKVTDMSAMFDGATSFNGNISSWDVSKVTDMSAMFDGATSFNGDLSKWDVSKVTDMSAMFDGATSFNGNISSWDVSKVTDMSAMFDGATSFNGNLSKWDVSKVTNMGFMFNRVSAFNGNISSWDVSKVTYMYGMFASATSFNGNLSKWDVSKVTNMAIMFDGATSFNGDLSKWDVSKVTNMFFMFDGATSFNGDLSKWDVSKVTNMERMFHGASAFNGNISSWDVSKVTDMSYMFDGATSFNQNLGAWYVALNDTIIKDNTVIVGTVSAQNSILDGHNPSYALAAGVGDTDNSLFTISGSTLSIKQSPTKATYSVRIGASGSGLFGQNNAVPVTITTGLVFISATYYPGNGTLVVQFSEALNATSHDASKIHIRNTGQSTGGVTLSNDIIVANGTNSITFDLGTTDTNTVNSMTAPQLDIDAGAVSDTAGNAISAISDQSITINDTTKPTFSSAAYTTGSGQLAITFSEPLDSAKHVATKLHIRESGSNMGGVTLSNGTITANGTNSLTITLSNSNRTAVAGLTTPQLDIDAGAVSDTSGNQIAAAADQTITINDTTKPTFSSAAYTTGSGQLAITFSEPLDSAKHVATKLHIRESGSNMGGVTLSNGTITANGTNSLTITLSNSNRTAVAGLTTPQLDIDAGAVSDTSGNQIAAAADQTITINDTTKPTFSSAAYTTGSGQLAITFSEPLDSAKHVATKLHIRESGSNMGGVTLSNGTITTNGTNSLTITLSNSNRTTVAGLTTPQLDIDAGAVSDTSGNQIAAAADQTITINDTTKPTFSSAAYTTGSGQLAITFSEPLDSAKHVATKLHIRESGSNMGGVTLSNGTITANGTNSLTITLSNSNRTAVAGLTTPQLDIDAGAVSDTSGNQIAAAADQTITINDTTKPTFSSAAYTTGSGQLAITFSEPLDSAKHVATKLHIRESGSNMGGVTLSNGTITANGTNSLTITLSNSNRTAVAGLTTPQLDIDAGAVSDTSGNQIAAAADQTITINDTTKPTFSSAAYTTGSGQLAITFSEPLDSAKHVATKLHIRESGSNMGGVTLSNGTITANGTNSLTITLSNSNRTAVAGLTTPQLDIDAGAVSDTSGNQIAAAADQTITINDTTKPTFSSAAYATGSGQLAITFSEPLDSAKHVATKLHIRESGSNMGGVTLSNGTITANGTNSLTITLSNSNRTAVAGLTTPQLDIDAGAVSDTSGNQIAAAADQTITINDTTKPTFSSAAYTTGSGQLAITFSEPLDSAKHVATKLHIRESGSNMGGVTLSNGTITANGTNSLTITLSNSNRTAVAGLTTPQLDIDAGAVSDTSGNQIAAAADQTITINDTTKPTFSSAAYTTGSGQLAITFSEPLDSAKHVATKLHIRESGSNMGGVTLSNGTITANGTNSLTITLSNSNRTAVAGLTTPQLDIDAGAVSDTSGNQIAAAADQTITINDTIRPTFSSAAYTTGSGQLAITFSEPLDSAKHVATKLHIRESGSNMGGVTLSNGTITANGTNSLTITLSNSNRTAVAGLTTPQLDIDAGAVSDTSGNQIAAAADQTITINDTTKPTFSSAAYATGSGQLAITFSEPLDSAKHVATKLHIRESGSNMGGVTLSNGTITANGTNSLTITLSNSNRTAVAGLTTPQLDIDAGAVSDTSGNQIAAAADQTITINDTTKPTFSSAAYTTGSGQLAITFSEPLDSAKHVATKLHIRESGSNMGGVTLSNGTITANGTNSLTITLSNSNRTAVAGLTTPQLDIDAGAVSDTSGNQIAAAADQTITINDTTKPTFSSAAYTTGSGQLAITFSEPLDSAKHVATKLHIRESGSNMGGVTLSNGTITANGTNSLTITLSNSNRTAVAGLTTPQLDIDAGAVSDTSGNQIAAAADQTITINDTIRPTFSSAAYTTGSGQLAITFSEPLDSAKHVATKLHIRESGSNMGGVTLSNGTITANGTNSLTITLSNSNRTAVAGLTTPQLDIDAGAVSDTSGNQIAAAADQTITINDTTKPTFSSAAYTTGSGQLAITFSEPLDSAKHVATKLHIRESGSNMGGVTLSNGTITANGTNSLTITLSNSNRTAVAGLTTPQLDIDAGAVSDTSGNQIAAAADQTITINDTTKPTFSSAAYTTGSGQLAITFSEPLDSAKHVATKLHIRESGSNMGGVTLSNGTITANGTNSLTITLSNSNRTAVAGLTTPQLDIDAGAVSDRAGNAISAISDRTVTVQDTIPPTLIYATYATGILTISFSEALDTIAHDASKIHIRNTNQSSGGVTLSNAMITATATDSITFTLNATHADRVNAMAAPELDIEQGAVRDVAGNFMSATHDNPISVTAVSPPAAPSSASGAFFVPGSTPPLLVMNDDSIRPEMVSARVDVSEPTLLVTFDEHVIVSDWSGFALRSGPNVLALAEPFNNGTRLVSAKIDGNLSDAITLDVAEGTVVDASGNANPPYGNLTLGLAPVMKSASYDNSTRILKITFDQSVMPGNLSRILLNGHAIGMSKPLGTLNGDTLYLALAETSLNASDNTVRVQTGAVLDGRGAPFETNQTVPLHLPQSYTAPPQAVYSAVSGTMWLEMDGGNISLDGSAITVRNSTAQIRLSDAHVMLNGVARYSGNATLSPGGDAVLHMDIPAGAIRADSGTVPATGNLAVDVFGGINTTAISGFHAGNDTISVSLMQPGLAVVASLQGISVFDIMNASARAAFVPLSLTVLDMNPVPNTDHLAVLAPGAVLFLDLADPASPKWAGVLNFTDAPSHGTVTPLIAEGVPYVVSVAEDTITQILASDPAKPKVVSSTTISRGPPGGSGSTSPGFDKLYTSLLPETICVVDVVAPQYDARCMAHSGTPGSMDAAVSGGALHLVSATDAPGASIRAGSLEEVFSVRTGDAPADIGVVDVYGTAYVLVAADVLYAFDMSGDVIHKGVDGPYVSLDVAEFGGSTYAALLDTGDTIHVINLDGP